ncbi:MAG: 5'-nucleotidase C-terminal domain-containing protein [Oscillospiraceae bacterium]|nr:5'-nucleotidase C-terminal domain-containing protein [Oscillospiraceae bacterium]
MKKALSLLLAFCLVFCLALPAAASSEEAGSAVDASEETPSDEMVIGYQAYEPVEDLGLDLDGLYTGEDYGDSLGDVTVAAGETWTVEDSCVVDRLEIEDGATVEADFPVIVFFSESDTVENGQVIGNVQFVSDYDEVVAIVHTNDTHGFLTTEPYVKGLKTQLEQSGNYSLVLAVSGGDLYAGGYAAAHVYEGEYIPYIMAMIYDYYTWGNNDGGITDQGLGTYFLSILSQESGLTPLLANQNASEDIDMVAYAESYEPAVGVEEFVDLYSDILSLNEDGTIDYSAIDLESYNLSAGDNALDDGVIVETANGTLIGLFGESTQGGSITDAYFAGGQSTITVAQNASDALIADGASAVVMVCHTGWMGADSTEASSNDTNSAQVALKTTGIDAIIDAHTHSVINDGEGWLFDESESDTIVNQANCKGEAIGVLYLYLKDGQVVAKDSENLTTNDDGEWEGIQPDEEVQAAVDRCYGRLEADGYTKVYATTEYFLNGERISSGDVGGGVRANETNLGDLVADGILYTAQQLWDGDEISIALYPGFWVRSSIEVGDITLVDALSVFANPLKIYYAEYTAQQLVSLMTTSCAKIGEENNNMYQVAGLTCTYDPDTFEVTTLTVGDELIYDHGEYLVDEDWTVGCAAEVGGGDMTVPDGTEIVASNSEMAQLWCEFLENAEYTIYPDEVAPAGRVTPAT